MAAPSSNLLLVTILLSLSALGYSQCDVRKIEVKQEKTPTWIHGKPEWNVTISNTCPCSVLNLVLNCTGFQTTEAVATSVLSVTGDQCLVNGGSVIAPKSDLSFAYAWDVAFPFTPISLLPACSQ